MVRFLQLTTSSKIFCRHGCVARGEFEWWRQKIPVDVFLCLYTEVSFACREQQLELNKNA